MANLSTLELSRLRQIACEVYKSTIGLTPKYISNFFQKSNSGHTTRNSNNLLQNHYNTVKYGKNSFVNFGKHLWNNLPNDLRSTTNYSMFKNLINTWMGLTCKCNFCRHSNNT